MTYRRSGRFKVTGAATLADGSVLMGERSFTLPASIAARLVHVSADALRGKAEIIGREIATLRSPLNIDNMEGIAARQDDAGHTFIYLLSDDNFSFLQRTLLLMFEWRRPTP